MMTQEEFLALRPRGQFWVFGYGSLMWAPDFRFRAHHAAFLYGLHRSLCVYSHRWRGTPEKPGLVMGLCRGGSCWGMAYHIAGADRAQVLAELWHREMRNRVYRPRFVPVRIDGARVVHALTFVADATHPQFAGDLDTAATARLVAHSAGERGRNIEYLQRTLSHMHAIGVRDPHLERVLRIADAEHATPAPGAPQR